SGRSEDHVAVRLPDFKTHVFDGREGLSSIHIPQRHSIQTEQTHQLPGESWTSGKNRSFHVLGCCFKEPISCMKSAYFMTCSGVVVNFTSRSFKTVIISSRENPLSPVDWRRMSAASSLSLRITEIASSSALSTAVYTFGFFSRKAVVVE